MMRKRGHWSLNRELCHRTAECETKEFGIYRVDRELLRSIKQASKR